MFTKYVLVVMILGSEKEAFNDFVNKLKKKRNQKDKISSK